MDRLDRDEGLPRVYKIFSCEGKACCHMSSHEEDPTMPLFNPFGMSGHKRWVKMTPSKKIFLGITRHVASERDIYDGSSTLKLQASGMSFQKPCDWAPCRLGFLGILSYK